MKKGYVGALNYVARHSVACWTMGSGPEWSTPIRVLYLGAYAAIY